MSGGLQLHPRYMKVAEATNGLRLTFIRIEERRQLTMEKVIEIFLKIGLETNKVEDLKDRKEPVGLDEVGLEFLTELKKTEEKYGLTQGESLKTVLEAAAEMTRYIIRAERHPNDPDKRGDEA